MPSAIYVIPTEGLDDGEILDSVLVKNLKPGPGSRCIILPEAGQGRPHPRVDAIYVVTDRVEAEEPGWDWELALDRIGCPQKPRWYDITEALARDGLVAMTIAHGDGCRIDHPASVALIWAALGW